MPAKGKGGCTATQRHHIPGEGTRLPSDSEVSHVAMHSFSSNIYTNISINNLEAPPAFSLQKALKGSQKRNEHENGIYFKGSLILWKWIYSETVFSCFATQNRSNKALLLRNTTSNEFHGTWMLTGETPVIAEKQCLFLLYQNTVCSKQ